MLHTGLIFFSSESRVKEKGEIVGAWRQQPAVEVPSFYSHAVCLVHSSLQQCSSQKPRQDRCDAKAHTRQRERWGKIPLVSPTFTFTLWPCRGVVSLRKSSQRLQHLRLYVLAYRMVKYKRTIGSNLKNASTCYVFPVTLYFLSLLHTF